MSRIAKDLALRPHYSNDKSALVSETSMHGAAPRIAIVGAGVSGLRCAALLARAKCHVTIYEARNRIGGRVHQELNGGHLVDMGSNWIHGTSGNPISKIAERTGTVVWAPEERSIVIDEDGGRRSEEESGELSAEFWGKVVEAFKYSDEQSDSIDKNTSLKDFLRQKWIKQFPHDKKEVKDLLNESAMWGQFVGGRVETQSLKFFFLEECLEGENVFVASTYHKILGEIARPVVHDETGKIDLRLSTEVERVQYRSKNDSGKVIVSTKSDTERFDEVVITCPLGWLKRNKDHVFSPSLPPRLSVAIDSIGYGALEKLYISFPSAWWMPAPSSKSKTTTNTATTDPKVETYPNFTSFHSPTYHPLLKQPSTSWNQSIISLAHLPNDTAHQTLLFYISGDCSHYLTRTLALLQPHTTEYNTAIQTFAAPFLTRLPNYSSSNPECQATSYLATSWSTDPHAGYGSYSNFPIGLEQGDKDIETMRHSDGLGEGGQGLWLAGEHTAPFVALGTTTGAYWSGEGVARRICRHYGLEVVEDELTDDIVKEQESEDGRSDQNGDVGRPEGERRGQNVSGGGDVGKSFVA